MINVALETAFNLLIVDILRLDDNIPLDTTVSPFLDFDRHTNKIILYADFFAYDENIQESLEYRRLRSTSTRDFMTCVLVSQPVVCQRPEI